MIVINQKILITLGPLRRWTEPNTSRSTKTKKATVINNKNNKLKLLKNETKQKLNNNFFFLIRLV